MSSWTLEKKTSQKLKEACPITRHLTFPLFLSSLIRSQLGHCQVTTADKTFTRCRCRRRDSSAFLVRPKNFSTKLKKRRERRQKNHTGQKDFSIDRIDLFLFSRTRERKLERIRNNTPEAIVECSQIYNFRLKSQSYRIEQFFFFFAARFLLVWVKKSSRTEQSESSCNR